MFVPFRDLCVAQCTHKIDTQKPNSHPHPHPMEFDFEDVFDAMSHSLLTPLLGDKEFEFPAAAVLDVPAVPAGSGGSERRPSQQGSTSSDSDAGDAWDAVHGCALCTNAPSGANPLGAGCGWEELRSRWHSGLRDAYARWFPEFRCTERLHSCRPRLLRLLREVAAFEPDKPLHSYVHCYNVDTLDDYLAASAEPETPPLAGSSQVPPTHKHCRNGLYRLLDVIQRLDEARCRGEGSEGSESTRPCLNCQLCAHKPVTHCGAAGPRVAALRHAVVRHFERFERICSRNPMCTAAIAGASEGRPVHEAHAACRAALQLRPVYMSKRDIEAAPELHACWDVPTVLGCLSVRQHGGPSRALLLDSECRSVICVSCIDSLKALFGALERCAKSCTRVKSHFER